MAKYEKENSWWLAQNSYGYNWEELDSLKFPGLKIITNPQGCPTLPNRTREEAKNKAARELQQIRVWLRTLCKVGRLYLLGFIPGRKHDQLQNRKPAGPQIGNRYLDNRD